MFVRLRPYVASPWSRFPSLGGRVLLVIAFAAGLSGCGSLRKKDVSRLPPTNLNPTYVAPEDRGLGRIISHDSGAGVALMEFSPFAVVPAKLVGLPLLTRNPLTLAPTAKLVASRRLAGNVLGLYVVEGTPAPGDEVVLPASSLKLDFPK